MQETSGSLQCSACSSVLPVVKGKPERQRAAPGKPRESSNRQGRSEATGSRPRKDGVCLDPGDSLASGSDTPRFDSWFHYLFTVQWRANRLTALSLSFLKRKWVSNIYFKGFA